MSLNRKMEPPKIGQYTDLQPMERREVITEKVHRGEIGIR
jgi:hypothetical protein